MNYPGPLNHNSVDPLNVSILEKTLSHHGGASAMLTTGLTFGPFVSECLRQWMKPFSFVLGVSHKGATLLVK